MTPSARAGEADRHAVPQYRRGERDDIVDRGRIAAVQQRAGAAREHQRLAGARSRSPGDKSARALRRRVGTPGRDQGQDRLDDAFPDRDAAHEALRGEQFVGRHRLPRYLLGEAGRRDQHPPLGIAIGIIDVDLQQKAVELRFRQRIGAFLLQRVLRREHMKRPRQRMVLPGDRHAPFLHRL